MGRPYRSQWLVVWPDRWDRIDLLLDGEVMSRHLDPFRTLVLLSGTGTLTSDADHLLRWACHIHQQSIEETGCLWTFGLTESIREHASRVNEDQSEATLFAMDTLAWGSPSSYTPVG